MKFETSKLDDISGNFFLLGFITSKLNLPILSNLISHVLNIFCLVCYIIGYTLWLIATLFYPDLPVFPGWYSFLPIKEQYQVSAFIGLSACVLCFFPSFIMPALWIFTLSNTIWCLTEYAKVKNPDKIENYSEVKQKNYFKYTQISTIVSLITACEATLALLFPVISLPLTVITFVIANTLTIISLYYWKISFKNEPITDSQSYVTLYEKLNQNRKSPSKSPTLRSANSEDYNNSHSLWENPDENEESSKTTAHPPSPSSCKL